MHGKTAIKKIMQVKFGQLGLHTPYYIQLNIASRGKLNESSKSGEQRNDSFKVF